MKINFRFLYIVGILAALYSDVLFSDLLSGAASEDSSAYGLQLYTRILVGGSILVSVLLYRYMRGITLWVFWGATTITALLVCESLLRYGVPMIYPHVFQKAMVLYILTASYAFYNRFGRITMGDISTLIWIGFVLNLGLVNYKAVSIGAFLNHDRGIVASSALLLVTPLLYHFNTYFTTRAAKHLLLFFMAAGAIFFFQHRTVWVVSAAALGVNFLLLLRVAPQRISLSKLTPMLGIPVVLMMLATTFILVSYPEVLEKVSENMSDIENSSSQGTGLWRREQFRSYWPFVVSHPVAGMRFEGFELPIQFYDPEQENGGTVFEDGYGHFFHSFYLDVLFYLGGIGLIVFILPHLSVALRLVRRPPVSPEALAWSTLIVSTLIYGYSYPLPLSTYGLIGFGLLRIRVLEDDPEHLHEALPTNAPSATAPSDLSVPQHA
ncbi:O-antigen ligase family protein [Hymenobacter sp. BT491]|uniref:O-antigen ligase family protein n=1 Tax=Hymenobacter sp. BT491 TaxID=2766779 RepID=UPI00165377F1|nr:O-antigen ligase family protein [Hymenobacter sp. BT491]MBC6988805.1 O-antigen ligase family protein [Hymenobacter sp. BT491]